MHIGDCFEMLKAGNKGIQNTNSKLYYFTRVSIQNANCQYFQTKDCYSEEDFFSLVKEEADAVRDESTFYINLLTKDCDWSFDDGKATIHWADPNIGKMMTVHLMFNYTLIINTSKGEGYVL